MSLIDQHKADGLQGKTLKQIVGFAGDGALRDGNETSREFREWLGRIQLPDLRKHAEECLESKFDESGRALQDIVNQIGRRLGFQVEDGRYRGAANAPGHDGVWKLPNGRAIVVEVKTTDVYRISLDTLADYRRDVVGSGGLREKHVSVLLVVGRDDTGGLEAQIRGSRHAWDMRVISVDALLKIAEIKERVEEPTFQRIHEVLIPKEFTRLDDIAELVLSTATDSSGDEDGVEEEEAEEQAAKPVARRTSARPAAKPISAGVRKPLPPFHKACVERVQAELASKGIISADLIRRGRSTFSTPDDGCRVVLLTSKNHGFSDRHFFFGLQSHQKEFLSGCENGWLVAGGDSAGTGTIFLMPWGEFSGLVPKLRSSRKSPGGSYVEIREEGRGELKLATTPDFDNVDLSRHLLQTDDEA